MRDSNLNNKILEPNKPIAIVLGNYPTTGLGVSRCLGRQGIPVIWLDSNPKQVGFLSTYCTGLACPQPKHEENDYVDFLLNLGEQLNQKGVLFPIGDIEVLTILKHRRRLEQHYHIPMANFKVSELLLDKQKFYKTLEKHGIAHPKTYFPTNRDELESISIDLSFPCIVKPAHSAYFRTTFNTKFFTVNSPQELFRRYVEATSNRLDVIIQELIPGNSTHMYGYNAYYDKDFKPNGVFMYRRIREWPPVYGNGVLLERITVPELEYTITSFVKKINYYGIVDAEFKKDPRNGLFNLLKINPRCWMQVSFPLTVGINIPYIVYLDVLEEEMVNMVSEKEQKKWLFFFKIFLHQ